MHRGLLFTFFFIGYLSFAYSQTDCFLKLEKAFAERGANAVPDGMHKNIVICFFNKERMGCYRGKVRVENGKITSVFLQYSDDSYVLYEDPFHNAIKTAPIIKSGISEMIYSAKGESFKIVFVDQLKPKTSGQILNNLLESKDLQCVLITKNPLNFYSTSSCLHIVHDFNVQHANKNLIFTSFTDLNSRICAFESLNKTLLN
jgi:hypothetical protein